MSVEDRQNYIKEYLRGKGGLSSAQIAGIIGNLRQENYNLDPTITGKTHGIAQWRGDRQTNLKKWSNPTSIDTQLNFLLHEIETGDGFNNKKDRDIFLNSKDVNSATKNFGELYERASPSNINMENRVKYANNVFGKQKWNWGKKGNNVSVDDVNSNLISYISSLPKSIQDKVLATAGSDGKHTDKSRHYSNNAVDLRFDQDFWNYIEKDPNRKKFGITLLNPNHGTAKHIHLSTGEGSESKKDVYFSDISSDTSYGQDSPYSKYDFSNQKLDYSQMNAQMESNQAFQKAMVEAMQSEASSKIALNQAQTLAIEREQAEKLALQEEEKKRVEQEQIQSVLDEKNKQREILMEVGLQAIPEFIEKDTNVLNQIASSPMNFQFQGGFQQLVQGQEGGMFHKMYDNYKKVDINSFKNKFIK